MKSFAVVDKPRLCFVGLISLKPNWIAQQTEAYCREASTALKQGTMCLARRTNNRFSSVQGNKYKKFS